MEKTHGFVLERERHIPELNSTARIYRHAKTGAELVSVLNDDENKAFGVSFNTPPADSTGIAHIMEHSVLCGSRKYPVKEPFIELAKGSLNTFLNAMTYPDHTVYPIASQNTQDLYNLADVYLDAVFYPNITEHTLQQEGWHYELDGADQPMIFKGVVFNEMKGANSSPERVLGEQVHSALFPDNIYNLDSGGDPRVIPNLTYKQFKDFHDTYYHPSNAKLWWYGNDEPEARLKYLDEWLSQFERKPVDASVALQPRFEEPRRIVGSFDAGEAEEGTGGEGVAKKQSRIVVAWMLEEAREGEKTMALNMLSTILVGTAASPLRKALIESGLGEDLAMAGMETDMRQAYFSVGMKGVASADAEKVEALILEAIKSLAENGIEAEMIEAAINSSEFNMREMNTGRFPRGLAMFLGALGTWTHGGDPLTALMYEAPLAAIKGKLANGEKVFENLIREYLLNNSHRVTVLLEPDSELRKREDAAERDRLDKAREALSEAEIKAIVENTALLKQMQETPDSDEALATIPSLKLSDMERTNKRVPIEISHFDQTSVLYHDLFTNGIAYVDFGFDVRALPEIALPYLGLFDRMFLSMGTDREDFAKLSQRINRKTGGVWASSMNSMKQGASEHTSRFFLRGKGTVAQVDDLLDIMRDIALTTKLDNKERFRQIVLEEKARAESGLVPGGHGIVNGRLKARFTTADWAAEQMSGITYLQTVRQLIDEIDKDWPSVLQRLEFIKQYLINRNAMVCNVTLDAANWAKIQPKVQSFVQSLPGSPAGQTNWAHKTLSQPEGLTIPAQVNYVGKGANLFDLGYQQHGSIQVISNYLRTAYLWERVRVQGGAYGGFCTYDARSGVWTYLSYRDPNLIGTLKNYDGTGAYLREHRLSATEVEKNIIGVIGSLDGYELPDAKGYSSMSRHLLGITDEYRQQMRDEVLSTTPDDFVKFADVLDGVRDQGQIVVLGSQGAIEAANKEMGGVFSVTKVL